MNGAMVVLERALALAAEGIPVFPCRADKAPACAGGFQAATRDAARVRALFATDSAALIGVATGAASGFDVVDIDPRHGGDTWWQAGGRANTVTRIHGTRGGGLHVFFRHAAGLRSSAGKIAQGVDVRADGGYVIWWPAADCPIPLDWELQYLPAWPAPMLEAAMRGNAAAVAMPGQAATGFAAPPSESAVVDLLNRLPNPLEADRNVYARVMTAAVACVRALGADDPEDPDSPIAAAAIGWAERYEGWDGTDEREKWGRDWSTRDRNLAGWQTLARIAGAMIPGFRLEQAAAEFEAQPPLEPERRGSNLDKTEDGLALAFCGEHEGRLVYDHTARVWWRWEADRWARDTRGGAFNRVREFLRGVRETGGGESSLARIATAGHVEQASRSDPRIAVDHSVWDTDPWLLGVPGGVLNLRTGKVQPNKPSLYIGRQTAAAPAAAGTPAPLWRAFLADATQGDADLQVFLQRLAGYMLTGDVSEEVLTFLHGSGGNGKGVFLGALLAILADYAITVPIGVFTVGSRENPEYYRARMAGARVVTASETEAGATWAESQIKELTGNEAPISARSPYGQPFEFRSQFKLIIVGNHAPRTKGRSPAMERRLRIVPFVHRPATPDADLKDKLRAEYPAILRWAIDGCLAWQRDRLGTARAIAAATGDYFESQDVMAQWIADRCRVDPAGTEKPAALHADFQAWLRGNRETPISAADFRAMLDRLPGVRRAKVDGLYEIRGLSLRADAGLAELVA